MPESVVIEKLESLNIRVQGVTQLQSGRRDQDCAKDRPPTPTSSYRSCEGRGVVVLGACVVSAAINKSLVSRNYWSHRDKYLAAAFKSGGEGVKMTLLSLLV